MCLCENELLLLGGREGGVWSRYGVGAGHWLRCLLGLVLTLLGFQKWRLRLITVGGAWFGCQSAVHDELWILAAEGEVILLETNELVLFVENGWSADAIGLLYKVVIVTQLLHFKLNVLVKRIHVNFAEAYAIRINVMDVLQNQLKTVLPLQELTRHLRKTICQFLRQNIPVHESHCKSVLTVELGIQVLRVLHFRCHHSLPLRDLNWIIASFLAHCAAVCQSSHDLFPQKVVK